MIFKRLLFSFIVLIAIISCSSKGSGGQSTVNPTPCSFSNPVAEGQDPWVTKKGDTYYYIESKGGGLYISKSQDLTGIKSNAVKVWSVPDSGWNQANLWAPELHYLNGKWYIYYAAGESGPPFIHQRSGVLESKTDDALGEYIDKGQLYTGDNFDPPVVGGATKENNKWSIDFTVLQYQDQLYGIWSGWEENRDTDKTPQHQYIAEMENPWTISSNRIKISSPVEPWETGTELAINEGGQILKNDTGEVYIIYSGSESWLPAYNLGQLKLTGDDPMNPQNWEKSGPVFQGTDSVYGVGHASFTTSPDGSELDCLPYESKS